jgi:hypothetical protein
LSLIHFLKDANMFPKAYIFYTIPNASMYLEVKTPNTTNIKLTEYSPDLKHHADVKNMWYVAAFQHPQTYFANVLVIPDINPKSLTYAHLVKSLEAIYCVASESGIEMLNSIANDIAKYGPDYSRLEFKTKSPASALFSYANPNQERHDLLHEAIHENFIQCQKSP